MPFVDEIGVYLCNIMVLP